MTRNRTRHALVMGGSLLATVTAVAAPPQITGFSPFGARRGEPTDVTVSGSNLGDKPDLIAPFGFKTTAHAANGKLTLTIDGETPIGVYPVRVRTEDGISNPLLFSVGQFPQVSEKEDNSSFETAQAFSVPAVIEGQTAGNDVDYFRFSGKKGQKIVVDAQCARIGSGVDPSVRLTTAARTYVASAEDSPGLLTDARLITVLPEDTDYVIELSDSRYQGGNRPIYRLVVGAVPVAEEVYPLGGRTGETVGVELRGGTLDGLQVAAARIETSAGIGVSRFRASGKDGGVDVESLPALVTGDFPEIREAVDPDAEPTRAAVPVVLNGRIDPPGDEDRFTLAVTPGQKVRILVEAAARGSALDGVLLVLDPKGAQLATADDTAPPATKKAAAKAAAIVSPDPSLDFTVPSGVTEITLALRDLESRGGTGYPYRIVVTPANPTFSVVLNDTQVNIPRGGTASIGVTVDRKGYNGPITLKVVNPPAGVTVRPGTVSEGQTTGVLTVSAAPDADFGVTSLDVVGETTGPDAVRSVRGARSIVFAQQTSLNTNTLNQVGLPAAPSLAQPVTLETPADPIEIAHGFGAEVSVHAVRGKDSAGVLTLTAVTPPAGLTVAAAKIDEKADDAKVALSSTTDLPLGPATLALVAKGKIGGSEQTVAAPAVSLTVVKPAGVELASASVEVKPGETAEVKGKVTRKGAFKDPITVKVNGLPAGLKADPVTVAADASDFTLKIVAEEKAAAATTPAVVALSLQVNKKDYPAPTAPLAVKVLAAK